MSCSRGPHALLFLLPRCILVVIVTVAGLARGDSSTLVAAGDSGTVLRSDDLGKTWNSLNTGTSQDFRDLATASPNIWWAVGTNGVVRKTVDGGANWSGQSTSTTNRLNGVDFVDENNGWAVGEAGLILNTTNGGTTWTTQMSGTGFQLFDVDMFSRQVGYVVGQNGPVLRTLNGGQTWTEVKPGTNTSRINVHAFDANEAWVVGAFGGTPREPVIHTTDGGVDWDISPSDIHVYQGVDFLDDRQYGWIAGGEGSIMITTNGGDNWTQTFRNTSWTDLAPGIDFADVEIHSMDNVYVSGGNGTILHTTDNGANWARLDTGTVEVLWDIVIPVPEPSHFWAVLIFLAGIMHSTRQRRRAPRNEETTIPWRTNSPRVTSACRTEAGLGGLLGCTGHALITHKERPDSCVGVRLRRATGFLLRAVSSEVETTSASCADDLSSEVDASAAGSRARQMRAVFSPLSLPSSRFLPRATSPIKLVVEIGFCQPRVEGSHTCDRPVNEHGAPGITMRSLEFILAEAKV